MVTIPDNASNAAQSFQLPEVHPACPAPTHIPCHSQGPSILPANAWIAAQPHKSKIHVTTTYYMLSVIDIHQDQRPGPRSFAFRASCGWDGELKVVNFMLLLAAPLPFSSAPSKPMEPEIWLCAFLGFPDTDVFLFSSRSCSFFFSDF